MRSLRTARHLLLAIVALLAFAPTASRAAQPEFYTRSENSTFEDPFLTAACGFPVITQNVGEIKGRNFYDDAGTLVSNFETYSHHFRVTFTNPAIGTTFTTAAPAVFRSEFNPDGTIRTFTVTGLQSNITVRAQGSIFHDAGRLVITEPFPGEITFDAGRHDYFNLVQGDVAVAQGLCQALAA